MLQATSFHPNPQQALAFGFMQTTDTLAIPDMAASFMEMAG
jgi:hypothetical protein